MSTEYEVHGLHDHAVEHATQQPRRDRLTGSMAVATALLATLGALFAYQGGAAESQALYYKNAEAVAKTEAANRWGYYQAKGEKQNLAELGAALSSGDPQKAANFEQQRQKYQQEKTRIRAEAEALERKVAEDEALSEAQLHQHHRWAQATLLVQVAISLAAICLLTRRRWVQLATYAAAGGGALLGLCALLLHQAG
ncbi:DUF4337 domain-containing protein [Pseudomonas citronellolis]|uniref:DUF4337 domain-containing protein n=1 Tax=Pseudomonas citronellolis TaxID=53408 RepID=UPI0023E3D7A7|nr:DUF4337 domain-containing protein [Pseudomonas citronellolis]MDF3933738.1 DUF4337 domain-containing protein [Pseudomonas citronellolis]